jgi:hypothetical protein
MNAGRRDNKGKVPILQKRSEQDLKLNIAIIDEDIHNTDLFLSSSSPCIWNEKAARQDAQRLFLCAIFTEPRIDTNEH